MKDQATHILLIRVDGKPVEAEYLQEDGIDRLYWVMKTNRIPVTGDWPTDKHVFAKDEVEEYELPDLQPGEVVVIYGKEYKFVRFQEIFNEGLNQMEHIIHVEGRGDPFERTFASGDIVLPHNRVVKRIRLKATLSDDRQSEVREQLGRAISSADKLLDFLEQPKQEAKTAWEVANDFAKAENGVDEEFAPDRMLSRRGFIAGAEWAKQQYQQEIVEKLTERINGLNWHGEEPDYRHAGLKLALNSSNPLNKIHNGRKQTSNGRGSN